MERVRRNRTRRTWIFLLGYLVEWVRFTFVGYGGAGSELWNQIQRPGGGGQIQNEAKTPAQTDSSFYLVGSSNSGCPMNSDLIRNSILLKGLPICCITLAFTL